MCARFFEGKDGPRPCGRPVRCGVPLAQLLWHSGEVSPRRIARPEPLVPLEIAVVYWLHRLQQGIAAAAFVVVCQSRNVFVS